MIFSLFSLIHCISVAQTTSVPDDNFEQALIDLGLDSGPLDDSVLTANINTVTNLDVAGLSISSLIGIEDFTALTILNCNDNTISALNLSQNTNLSELYCNNNLISNLNVTMHPALKIFWCNNNQLTSLNVSAITTLIELNCIDNNLTSIDVSSNTNLDILKVYNNELTSLNVTSNTALTDLECNGNYITSLDVSNNLDLIWLITGNNNITSLDLSANTSLIYLECNDNALTSLNIANGNNASLVTADFDATNNPNLTCIEVDNVAYSTTNWTNIDATASFSTNCGALSVDDFSLNTVSIYPNPTTSVLNIKMDSNLKSATIYSILGKKVLETTSNNINTSNLNSGLYLIKIASENGSVATKKFMKE